MCSPLAEGMLSLKRSAAAAAEVTSTSDVTHALVQREKWSPVPGWVEEVTNGGKLFWVSVKKRYSTHRVDLSNLCSWGCFVS